MSKYRVWARGGRTVYDGDNIQTAIIVFVFVLTKVFPKPENSAGIIGINFAKYADEPVIEGYVAHSKDDVTLLSVLYGATEEDYNKYGPPTSTTLSDDEVKKRLNL